MVTACLLRVALALCVFSTCQHAVFARQAYKQINFQFPEYKIEAFSPRGLRVSIPDVAGLQLFAFHGNVNKRVDLNETGELSRDIVRKTGGRWTFEDKYVQLSNGDMLHFWLYAIHNRNGYRQPNQSYTVNELLPQPETWTKNRQRPTRPTTPTTKQPQIEECACPVVSPCTTPASTGPLLPPTSTSPSAADTIVSIWAESLNNATGEKLSLLRTLDYFQTVAEHLTKVMEMADHPNLRRLIMSGRLPPGGDAEDFLDSVLKDKLMLKDKVVDAYRDMNGNIIFEMENYKAKLNVIYAAKDKMKFSPISIQDPILVSPLE